MKITKIVLGVIMLSGPIVALWASYASEAWEHPSDAKVIAVIAIGAAIGAMIAFDRMEKMARADEIEAKT